MRLTEQQAEAWHRCHYYYLTAAGKIRSKPRSTRDAIHLLRRNGHTACGALTEIEWASHDIALTTCWRCVTEAVIHPSITFPSTHMREEAKP